MKIRLLCDLPVDRVHGMVEGRVLETIDSKKGGARSRVAWWVKGHRGEHIGVMSREAEIVADNPPAKEQVEG